MQRKTDVAPGSVPSALCALPLPKHTEEECFTSHYPQHLTASAKPLKAVILNNPSKLTVDCGRFTKQSHPSSQVDQTWQVCSCMIYRITVCCVEKSKQSLSDIVRTDIPGLKIGKVSSCILTRKYSSDSLSEIAYTFSEILVFRQPFLLLTVRMS